MESSYPLRFAPADTFEALVWAISELDGYQLHKTDKQSFVASIDIESTLLLPHEKLTAEILPAEGGTSKIRVTANGDPDNIRLQHRVNMVLCALSEQLANGHLRR